VAGILTICAEGFKSGPPLVTIQPIEHRAGGPLVRPAHDLVAIEDRPRLVAGQTHGNPLRQPAVDQPPHHGSPEVMLSNPGTPAALHAVTQARRKSRTASFIETYAVVILAFFATCSPVRPNPSRRSLKFREVLIPVGPGTP
jgi:hypothetical protein